MFILSFLSPLGFLSQTVFNKQSKCQFFQKVVLVGVIIKGKHWMVFIPIILHDLALPEVLALLFSLAGYCYYFVHHNQSWGGPCSLKSLSLVTGPDRQARQQCFHSLQNYSGCPIS